MFFLAILFFERRHSLNVKIDESSKHKKVKMVNMAAFSGGRLYSTKKHCLSCQKDFALREKYKGCFFQLRHFVFCVLFLVGWERGESTTAAGTATQGELERWDFVVVFWRFLLPSFSASGHF